MAIIELNGAQRPARGGFLGRAREILESYRQYRGKLALYRQTYDELAQLNERDLADLGIARSDIEDIAREAAGLR